MTVLICGDTWGHPAPGTMGQFWCWCHLWPARVSLEHPWGDAGRDIQSVSVVMLAGTLECPWGDAGRDIGASLQECQEGRLEHPWAGAGRNVQRFKEQMRVLWPGMVALSP